jgi:PhnB protein
MTFDDLPLASSVYLDVNTFIYHFSAHPKCARLAPFCWNGSSGKSFSSFKETTHERPTDPGRLSYDHPNTIVQGVEKAIAFYKAAFGAEEKLRLAMPDGTIVHSELMIGDSRLNLAEPMEGWPVHPLLAQLFVEDSDAIFQQAVAAGATVAMPMTDMFFGFREGRVVDPFGNTWTISSRKEIVSPQEMQRRLNAFAS